MRPLLVPAPLLVALVAGAACGQVKPMPTPVEPIRTDNVTAPSFEHRVQPEPAEEPGGGEDTASDDAGTRAPGGGAEPKPKPGDGGMEGEPPDGGTAAPADGSANGG